MLFNSTNFSSDMIKRRNLRTRSVKMFILDESDEMLNKGFKEQIYDVYRFLFLQLIRYRKLKLVE